MSEPRVSLAALLDEAAGRAVWGIDAKGRGGRVTAKGKTTDGWNIQVELLALACIEGQPWRKLKREASRGDEDR